jgi:hypothetical protein
MAGRIRSIKPEWLEGELAVAPLEARVLSVALILMADDQGNGHANPVLLASRVFPGLPREVSTNARRILASLRYVVFYEVDKQEFFHICNWHKHQKIDRPSPGKVPDPPAEVMEDQKESGLASARRILDESSTNDRASRASLPFPDPRSGSLDPKCRSGDQPVRLIKSASKAAVLYPDWKPDSEQAAALAAKHGVTVERVLAEVPEFIWYWTKGAGAGKRRNAAGWARCFANRVDSQAKSETLFAEPRRRGSGQRGRSDAVDIAFARVRELNDLELTERDEKDLQEVFGR